MIAHDIPLIELPETLDYVYQYWRNLDGEALGCSWTDFKLERLPPQILPSTLVIDVKPDITQNVFRFWGTAMTRIHGQDLTGKTTSDLLPLEFQKTVHKSHARIVRNPAASAGIFGFERHGGFDHLQTLLRLPLSNDGSSVSQIVVAIESTDEGKTAMRKKELQNSRLWEDGKED